MAVKPGAYYQPKHNSYRYYDGKAWVGARYATKEEAVSAYNEHIKRVELEQQKAKQAAEQAKKKKVKPKKQRFLHRPKALAWVICGILLLISSMGLFMAYDSSQRISEETGNYPNGSVWVDPKPVKPGDMDKSKDKNKNDSDKQTQKSEDSSDKSPEDK